MPSGVGQERRKRTQGTEKGNEGEKGGLVEGGRGSEGAPSDRILLSSLLVYYNLHKNVLPLASSDSRRQPEAAHWWVEEMRTPENSELK